MTVSSKWRAALVATAASAALVAAPVVGAQSAQAQPYPPSAGVTLSDYTVTPGESITFTGTGFHSGQRVEADLFSTKVVLGRFTADRNGTVDGTVTIPDYTRPGEHLFALEAHDPDITACAQLTVEGTDETPPPNGGHDHDPGNGGHDQDPGNGGHDQDPGNGGHDQDPGNGGPGRDPGNGGSWHQESHNHKPHLANTGDNSPYLLGGAAALVLFGGWALMAARRLKRR